MKARPDPRLVAETLLVAKRLRERFLVEFFSRPGMHGSRGLTSAAELGQALLGHRVPRRVGRLDAGYCLEEVFPL